MSLILGKPTHHKTIAKSKKTKPIKVVYISNPMKFKTSASNFMALVQELTGQDSEFPPVEPTAAFSEEPDDTSTGSENDQTVVVNDDYGAILEVPIVEDEHDDIKNVANSMMLDFDFGPFDHYHDHEVSSTPMMLESFGGLIFPI